MDNILEKMEDLAGSSQGRLPSVRGNTDNESNRGDERLRRYPASLLMVAAWVAYIAALLVLLELTVRNAPLTFTQPWYYDWLPTNALTLFGQMHGPITTAFLARIAISALQKPKVAPRTWAEIYKMADGAYSTPSGAILAMYRTKLHLSATFYYFMVLSALAIAAPQLLTRAYPLYTIDAVGTNNIYLSTFSPALLLKLDSYREASIATGTMSTGISVLSLFNTSTYLPSATQSRKVTPSDMIFAGDTAQMDVVLDGLRITGGCQSMAPPGNGSFTDFANMCTSFLAGGGSDSTTNAVPHATTTFTVGSVNIITSQCVKFDSLVSSTTGILWVDSNNGTSDQGGTTVNGVVSCSATLQTVTSTLYGKSGSFDPASIVNTTVFDPNQAQQGEPLLSPLRMALQVMANVFGGGFDPKTPSPDPLKYIEADNALSMFGYTILPPAPGSPSGSSPNFSQPTIDTMADYTWNNVLHATAALGLGSQASNVLVSAVEHQSVGARVRESTWATALIAVLAVWLFMILVAAATMYTPAIGNSLNSYTAARLMVKHPQLVDEDSVGTLDDNRKMNSAFAIFDIIGDLVSE